jgi:hypothetical protein
MDIIGNGSPVNGPRPATSADLPLDRYAEDDLDLDLDLDAQPEPRPREGRRLLADVVSAESLAVAALAIGMSALVGSPWLMYVLFSDFSGVQPTPQQELRQRATVFGVGAAFTLAPGLGALLRRTRPTWVRGVAGGAVVLGLLLLGLAVMFLWRSADAPGTVASGLVGT